MFTSDDPISIEGRVRVSIVSELEDSRPVIDVYDIRLTIPIISPPDRSRRVLWDQFHNLKYPESNYIPRDSLTNYDYPYEWHGDHPFLNFQGLWQVLRNSGYFLEISRGTFECFNASDYGILLLVDPEEKFSKNEILKLQKDITVYGLNLILFAEWWDYSLLDMNSYYSKTKKQSIIPVTG